MLWESGEESGGGDPVFCWLDGSCIYTGISVIVILCCGFSWHHLGALCGNMIGRQHQIFGGNCGCSHDRWYYPRGCNQNTMDTRIAVSLTRTAIEALRDVPPVVSPSDVPLASILTSRMLRLARGYKRLVKKRRRDARRNRGLNIIHLR